MNKKYENDYVNPNVKYQNIREFKLADTKRAEETAAPSARCGTIY